MTVNDLYWITENRLRVQIAMQNKVLYEGTIKDIPTVFFKSQITYISQSLYGTLYLAIKEITT